MIRIVRGGFRWAPFLMLFVVGHCAAAGKCDEAVALPHWKLAAVDPEQTFGIKLGLGERELRALIKESDLEIGYEAKTIVHVKGEKPLSERTLAVAKKDPEVLQSVELTGGRVVAIYEHVHGLELPRAEALEMFKSFTEFLCWRFGSWSSDLFESDTPWLAVEMLGPSRILREAHGRDDKMAFDVWVSRGPREKGYHVRTLARLRGYGETDAEPDSEDQ